MAVTIGSSGIAPDPGSAPRRLTILGSTGSIGTQTIDLIDRNPEAFEITALTAYQRVDLLAAQARQLRPGIAVVADDSRYADLREALSGSGIEVAAGTAAVVEAAARPADLVMAGIVGAAGLAPTLAAIRQGAAVAFANKECLVCAGALMMAEVARYGATVLPVDSEHNAIFQCFDFERVDTVERIILTASGGPFRTLSREAMAGVTPEQAVAHPNWTMGAKISVDSATMMNKGLEVIEAHHIFGLPGERIDIVVHPQSVVHSMVSYVDGSVLAQLGTPDMRTPIAYALAWPRRMTAPVERLDLVRIAKLEFEAPDEVRFPSLRLARQALHAGGAAPTALNAANEEAVFDFLRGGIGFLDIADVVEATMDRLDGRPLGALDDVFAADDEARAVAREQIASRR
jgi:1-deoxy-D-xylulose-5-phosphate reductoisomerase